MNEEILVLVLTLFMASGEAPKTVAFESRYCEENKDYISDRILRDSKGAIVKINYECKRKI